MQLLLAPPLSSPASACKEGPIMLQSLLTPYPHRAPPSLPRHPRHSACRLGLITALTSGQKTQHQNFAH